MRHQWYGDGKDLIKWGTLVHLAQIHNLKRIIQIAYFRPDSPRPLLEGDDNSVPIPDQVYKHFRNVNDISRLSGVSGIEIEIISDLYDPKQRAAYTHRVLDRINSVKGLPILAFLDPDTGIAERNAKPEHVTPKEVRNIWDALKPDDWLVLYQHRYRKTNWEKIKLAEFQRAIGTEKIETFREKDRVTDVVFFCVAKE
jgi:hypothetical protein